MTKLWRQGLVDIDAPVANYADPVLRKQNGTTLLELWHGDRTILNVTARMLMGMRGGLWDYNDTWYFDETINDPAVDVTPFDLLHLQNKTWNCRPGTCGQYASTGFEILGLVLMGAAGSEHYYTYDQKSMFRTKALRAKFAETAFPGPGPCSQDHRIVHQYATTPYSKTKHGRHNPINPTVAQNLTIKDLINGSCLNGWTCGNIAASPADIAQFHWELHHGNIVSKASLEQMMHFVPMKTGWSPQLYGLGLMHTFPYQGWPWLPDPANDTYTIGHAGADYGSLGMMSGWNVKHGFGVAFTTNTDNSLNCSHQRYDVVDSDSRIFFVDALCPAYDEVLQVRSTLAMSSGHDRLVLGFWGGASSLVGARLPYDLRCPFVFGSRFLCCLVFPDGFTAVPCSSHTCTVAALLIRSSPTELCPG